MNVPSTLRLRVRNIPLLSSLSRDFSGITRAKDDPLLSFSSSLSTKCCSREETPKFKKGSWYFFFLMRLKPPFPSY